MSGYHFERDCVHFPECREEIIKQGRHEIVKLTCPVGGTSYYYKGDMHAIKWENPCFEPSQMELPIGEQNNF